MAEEHPNAITMRTLRLAAEAFGGEAAFAVYLNVPEADVKAWIEGSKRPSNVVFFKALDVVAAGPFSVPGAMLPPEIADRAQEHADRMQSYADRAQRSADRAQSLADRAQERADRTRVGADAQADLDAVKRIEERAKSG